MIIIIQQVKKEVRSFILQSKSKTPLKASLPSIHPSIQKHIFTEK